MAERAYNLPSANVHTLKYTNAHDTPIYTTLTLDEGTSGVLFLEPMNSDRTVELPNPVIMAGALIWIHNTSGLYNLYVSEYGTGIPLTKLEPDYRTVAISDGVKWTVSTSTPSGSATNRMEIDIGPGSDWVLDNSGRPANTFWYYNEIIHNLGIQFLSVTCIDRSNNSMIIPADITFVDINRTKIWVNSSTLSLKVVLVG